MGGVGGEGLGRVNIGYIIYLVVPFNQKSENFCIQHSSDIFVDHLHAGGQQGGGNGEGHPRRQCTTRISTQMPI